MWGFCAGLELSIDKQCLHSALEDYPLRGKLPWLESDLCALGYSRAAIMQLPTCPGFAFCSDAATAFGRLYVLEGASLGGRTLLPQVYKHLGCSAESGAAFLASYGANVQTMWQRFGAALDAWCMSPERVALATCAAIATFEGLERWLCGDAP
jgi:heme oxygenase